MRVYRPTVIEGQEWVLPDRESDFRVIRSLAGTSQSTGWSSLPVHILHEDKGRRFFECDFPWLGDHALVCGRTGRTALEPLLGADAELLPLACDERELWLMNVLRVVDALDQDRSDIVRFPSTGRIMTIKRPMFKIGKLDGVGFFKVLGMEAGRMYVTGGTAETLRAAGMSGLKLAEVWSA